MAIKHNKRIKGQLALFFIDLDKFKHINDSFGHSIGDQVLKNASQRFRESLRDDDVIGRWGGDEFMLYMDNFSSTDDVIDLAEKLITAFETPLYTHQQQSLFVSVNIGIAIYPDDANRRLLVETHLRQGIANNEIYVVNQPKIDAQSYEIEGAEALVR